MSVSSTGLRRVVYVSHVAADALPGGRTMLEEILAAARRNNSRVGVTGALLYSDRRFAQVLEGPPEAVEEIFESIQCDPRHDQIAVLEVSSPDSRAFADWSMAFTEAPEVHPEELDSPEAAQRLVGLLQAAIRNTEAATA
ncbi:MAG TPA: BLUF domain-containing protein [Falsiroseomonas sp.]|jgi:hypothetical protein|nr:BLUF domain-containing protein [Falsiroseomonas sp.]